MTENEAKEYLLNRYLVVGSPLNPPKGECERHNAVLDIAIKALEEIQQYRTIGTVEELKKVISFLSNDEDNSIIDDINLLNKYRAVGTVEEFKALKEKNEPKKAEACADIYYGNEWIGKDCRCSNCGFGVAEDYNCCPYCGQVLDWSEGE